MKFASARIKSEWNDKRLKPILKEIVADAAQYAAKKWNWEFLLTSIFRTKAEDDALNASGIHVEWRAVDVRTKDKKRKQLMGLRLMLMKNGFTTRRDQTTICCQS